MEQYWWDVLGVRPNATRNQIERAHASKKYGSWNYNNARLNKAIKEAMLQLYLDNQTRGNPVPPRRSSPSPSRPGPSRNLPFGDGASARGGEMARREKRHPKLGDPGWSVKKVAGDGHCFYRAVVQAQALDASGGTSYLSPPQERSAAMALRQMLADHIRERAAADPSFRELVESMMGVSAGRLARETANEARWAEHLEIALAAEVIGRPIIVYVRNPGHGRNQGHGIQAFVPPGASTNVTARGVVRLVSSDGRWHYDALYKTARGR